MGPQGKLGSLKKGSQTDTYFSSTEALLWVNRLEQRTSSGCEKLHWVKLISAGCYHPNWATYSQIINLRCKLMDAKSDWRHAVKQLSQRSFRKSVSNGMERDSKLASERMEGWRRRRWKSQRRISFLITKIAEARFSGLRAPRLLLEQVQS